MKVLRIIFCLFLLPVFIYGKPAEGINVNGNLAHPSRILVCYRDETQVAASTSDLKKLGLKKVEKLRFVPGLYVLDETESGDNSVAQLPDEEKAKRLLNKIESLKKTGLFKYVEPDYVKRKHITPNDAAFVDGRLWGLRNTGQSGGVSGADINAVSAWGITTGSPAIIVAIIDSGIRYTHSDLNGNMWRNPGEIPNNGIDDDNDGYIDDIYGINAINGTGDPMDDDGHGTHIAGIIGSLANNGQPNVGVAWNVKLMACKFLDASGGGKISDEIKSIDYAISKGAKILNMSFGDNAFSQAEYDAIMRAFNHNALVIASAGNESVNNDTIPTYPANYNIGNIISVAAFNRYNQLASFSNFGSNTVHIAAPGESIFSTWNGSDYDYKTVSGTSMAAPYVSGIAALVLSVFPQINAIQLRSQILQSAVQVPSMNGKVSSNGRVDAFRALNGAPDGVLEITVNPENGRILGSGTKVDLTISVTDLYPVTNATITAIFANTNLLFTNSGTNYIYTSPFQVPLFAENVSIAVSITAPGKVSTNFTLTYPIAIPPSNDDFYKSAFIPSGTNIELTAINTLASKQQGEPAHARNSGGKSLWWSYLPNSSGLVMVSTDESDFDTLLAVYTGNSITNLRLVAANDDFSGNNFPRTSRVYFYASNNVPYHIAVDGYSGASGNIRLKLNLNANFILPQNDNFTNRQVLTGDSLVVIGTNIGATIEINEPSHSGRPSGASVWYSWTAQFSGQVSMDTLGSEFDTIIAVYTGNSLETLTEVASNDDVGDNDYTSKVVFYVSQGVTYQIAISGYDSDSGKYYLSINKIQGGSSVPNDMFTNAIVISQLNSTIVGSNVGATKEPGEPDHAGNIGGSSVWYKWTAPSNTVVVISTENSDFDTLLAVYTGTTLQTLTLVAENDDDYYGVGFSKVTFRAISNQTYFIAVDGYAYTGGSAEQGIIRLTIQPVSPPPNDNFENRITLSGIIVEANGTNLGATSQSSEPYHSGYSPTRSVWWQWTAQLSGYTLISTDGSDFDTLIGVYTGNNLTNLTPVAGGDDSIDGMVTSKVLFYAQAGTIYQIAIDGYAGSSGKIKLKIAQNYSSTNIYYTGFSSSEGFVVGRQVAGIGGWQCNFNGGNGILANRFPDKGQQAYIGYSPTYGSSSGVILLWRPINYIPETNSIIVFSVYMSIIDSTDSYYDNFGWSVYNILSNRLFTINFDNSNLDISYALDDNQGLYSADMRFNNDTIYKMTILMDFQNNKWSAYLNSVPIAEGKPITTQGANLDLGDIDARWIWSDIVGGNNFMVFDDYTIDVVKELKPPSIILSPQSTNVFTGDNILLNVQASGAQPLYYQWYFNGVPISGATSSNLVLANITTNKSGIYSVIVSNLFGTATSQPATLIVNQRIIPPPNDNFINRAQIGWGTNTIQSSNRGATRETGEPYHYNNVGGSSVWWSWRAPFTGRFTISTVGSDFDTLLAVYEGNSIGNLILIASNDDAQTSVRASWLWFNALSNKEYQIVVDGFNGATGNIVLSIKADGLPQFSQWEYNSASGFTGSIIGESGLFFSIQSSTNLKDWVTVTNIFNVSGKIEFIDFEKGSRYKFYRAIHSP